MIQKLQNNEKGFTLIELMIVIAIIGILSAIAIPNFLQYRQRGYDAQALSNAKNFFSACSANSTGQTDQTFDASNLPPGYQGEAPTAGSFVYTAATGAITCNAAFKHANGTVTYTLNNSGQISES